MMTLMSLMLRKGEKLRIKGRVVTVTSTAFDCLPRVRDRLIEAARARETLTYGELRDELELPYPSQGMGWLLDLVIEDCSRRGEPSLASLVVNASTREVGHDFDGDAPSERVLAFERRTWS